MLSLGSLRRVSLCPKPKSEHLAVFLYGRAKFRVLRLGIVTTYYFILFRDHKSPHTMPYAQNVTHCSPLTTHHWAHHSPNTTQHSPNTSPDHAPLILICNHRAGGRRLSALLRQSAGVVVTAYRTQASAIQQPPVKPRNHLSKTNSVHALASFPEQNCVPMRVVPRAWFKAAKREAKNSWTALRKRSLERRPGLGVVAFFASRKTQRLQYPLIKEYT